MLANVTPEKQLMNPVLGVGDTVSTEVPPTQVYGVFCRYASKEVFVVTPETS